jgi:hypothetical protein
MKSLLLGKDRLTGKDVHVPRSSFDTHWHLIGGTGKGKTTAINTLLQKLLLDRSHRDCFVIVDRMGGFSFQLLLWMASKYCTQQVRDRLVYFEAAREDVVLPFNPLVYDTSAHGHFKVSRATEAILRGWESQNIEAMPRLARWVFNAFWSAAQLGLTVSDCVHFLTPGSTIHSTLVSLLPEQLQHEWQELKGNNSEISRILESTRNRLKPYFENDILRRMFSGTRNRLDILKFMKQGKILLVNLAPQNRLSPQVSDAIGGLIINEVLATARSLPGSERYPTYLWLDEFQKFVGPDLEEAIPEVRQLGLKLILAHQSLSQLERGDHDLRSLIFQAQSRMVFGVQGEDADILANEFAALEYDPDRIKNEIYSRRQLHKGFRTRIMHGGSESESKMTGRSDGGSFSDSDGRSVRKQRYEFFADEGVVTSENSSRASSYQDTRATTNGSARSWNETLVPEYEDFVELSSRSYVSFDEQRTLWSQKIRKLNTGTELMRVVDDPNIYEVDVQRSAPGFLAYDLQTIHKRFPQAIEAAQKLVEDNFRQEEFCSPREIELESGERLKRVLGKPIIERSREKTAETEKMPFL